MGTTLDFPVLSKAMGIAPGLTFADEFNTQGTLTIRILKRKKHRKKKRKRKKNFMTTINLF